LPGYLTGTFSIPGHQYRHAGAWFSGRQVVVALIVIAVIAGLLAGPILAEALLDIASKAVERAAPGTFVLGLAVLLTGLISGVRIIDIAGACLIGAVLLAVILDNYLPTRRMNTSGPPGGHSHGHTAGGHRSAARTAQSRARAVV
jgi:hypothetical protein